MFVQHFRAFLFKLFVLVDITSLDGYDNLYYFTLSECGGRRSVWYLYLIFQCTENLISFSLKNVYFVAHFAAS